MILVALGAQDFQFDRLLKKIDELVEKGVILDTVMAQAGSSRYKPKHYEYRDYLTYDEFDKLLSECSLLIAHGGTGTLVGGLKKGKRVIAVPRQSKYGEAVDDHQAQIIDDFVQSGMLLCVVEMEEMEEALEQIKDFQPKPFVSGLQNIIGVLENFMLTIQPK